MGKFKWMAGLLLMMALLHWPEAAIRGIQQAVYHWYYTVAPSLFPFMVLMPLLTCQEAARAYEHLLGGCMRRLFRLPGAAAPAFVIGMVAGSPAGVTAARRVAAQAGMNEGQLQRLAISVCGLSPAFLLTGVGMSMLGSSADGMLLLRTQIVTQLLMALILRNAWKNRTQPVQNSAKYVEEQPVRAAISSVLTVCGYMALFGGFGQIVQEMVGATMSNALLCVLDLPSGARIVTDLPLDREVQLVLLSALIGFGGICIGMQNLSILRDCGIRSIEFYGLRILAAIFSVLIMLAQLHLPWQATLSIVPNPMALAALVAIFIAIPIIIMWKKRYLNN